MAKRNEEKARGYRIYIGDKGHRYVKIDEVLKDPVVIERLNEAESLARKLGLKIDPDTHSPDA